MAASWPSRANAHSGPPFPIVEDGAAGPYRISVWTDPDVTDDATAAGRFWVTVHVAGDARAPVPEGTRVRVSLRPSGTQSAAETAAPPVPHKANQYFVAVVLDHEGPWLMEASAAGPLGQGRITARVDATYDLRPAPLATLVFVFPFLAVGALWLTALWRRRRPSGPARPDDLDP